MVPRRVLFYGMGVFSLQFELLAQAYQVFIFHGASSSWLERVRALQVVPLALSMREIYALKYHSTEVCYLRIFTLVWVYPSLLLWRDPNKCMAFAGIGPEPSCPKKLRTADVNQITARSAAKAAENE
ncbi:unnamed protein product, partial [Pylaiella littoralis]